MKRKVVTILLVLIFLAGLSLLLYPIVFDAWNTVRQNHAIAQYEQLMTPSEEASSDGETVTGNIDLTNAELLRAREYNTRIGENFSIDLKDEALHQEYLDILNPGDMEIMGVLSIPKISVKLPIYHGTSDGVLQVGIGHMEGTSLPVGGYSTHSVLSGHTGLPSARLLTDLTRLVVGDTFSIEVQKQTLHYRVDQIKVVLPTDFSDLMIEPGKDYVTIVTCTPYGINSHRLLVRGRRITVPDLPTVVPDAVRISTDTVALAIGLPPGLLCMMIALIVFKVKNKRERKAEDSAG